MSTMLKFFNMSAVGAILHFLVFPPILVWWSLIKDEKFHEIVGFVTRSGYEHVLWHILGGFLVTLSLGLLWKYPIAPFLDWFDGIPYRELHSSRKR